MPAVNYGEGGVVSIIAKVGSKIFRIFKINFQIPSHLFSASIQDKALLLLLGRQGVLLQRLFYIIVQTIPQS